MIDVNNRCIAMIGCGFEGHRLYSRLRARGVTISFVVDNYRTDNFWGMKVEQPKSVLEYNPYFLISPSRYYDDIKKQLMDYGLKEFYDFAKGNAFGKKICIINANCYGPIYESFLYTNDEFEDRYYVYDSMPLVDIRSGKRDLCYLQNCDICLTQDIENTSKNYFFSTQYIYENVAETAKVIIVPNLVGLGRAFFPYGDTKNYRNNDYGMQYGMFPYREVLIDDYLDRGLSYFEIINNLMNGNDMDSRWIKTNYSDIFSSFMEKEKKWDIKIVEYIKSISKKTKVFYDLYHPTNEVIARICDDILKSLGINSGVGNCKYDLGEYEMPIYPCVADALELNWYDTENEIRSESRSKFCKKETINEYVKEYIDWCYVRNRFKNDF